MRTPRTRTWILLAVLVAAGAGGWLAFRRGDDPDAPPPPPAHVAIASDNFAILVGCTEYPELKRLDPGSYESNVRLLGPGNDVVLMRDTLVRYLGVPEANVRVLTGWPDDPAARPTRANVLGHLERLAREVARGTRVLFLFAGHGSQQPDEKGGDEADGADEILMPADAGKWDEKAHGIANAITDDEIRARLEALRAAGAEVLAVFDCCHSGTMLRGTESGGAQVRPDVGPVRSRGLKPEFLGVPDSLVGASRRGLAGADGFLKGSQGTGIAAISAAHSSEPAPEMVLPSNRAARDRTEHGLCTFHVARALQRYGGSLTIGEIFAHVNAAYDSMPWDEAKPLVEGDLSLRVTSGSTAGGPLLLLRRESGRLLLDAGSLRGLTVGTVIEVFRSGRFGDASASLGRLVLTEVEPLHSVCGPVAGGPDPAGIADGVPCRIVEIAPGGPPLRIALMAADGSPLPIEFARRSPSAALLDASTRARFPFVDPKDAEWNLRPLPTGSDGVARFVLWSAATGAGLEPLEVDSGDLVATLERVRRAESLRTWASSDRQFGLPESLKVVASLRRQGSETSEPFVPGVALLPGDSISLLVTNGTDRDVDLVVNCLDSSEVESNALPEQATSRRVTREEKSPVVVELLPVGDDGLGRESFIVVVAVRAPGAGGSLDVGSLVGRVDSRLPRANSRSGRRSTHYSRP